MRKNNTRRRQRKSAGGVALVGAGPGDPGLITVRGRALLAVCDTVIYDALVARPILSLAPQAKRIRVSRRSADPHAAQDAINRMMIGRARRGENVVRLKGGDPFIFGRGAEEALALRRAKVAFEIVPGVSAGHAVPAYAGIPLTHRDAASQVTFVTGHEAPRKGRSDVNWPVLARQGGTIVLFMGLGQLPNIVGALRRGGLRGSTRISVIEWGTTGRQTVVSGILSRIVERVRRKGLNAPALAVIGEVNRFRSALNWFEHRPLFGQTVVVTRAHDQAGALSEKFRQLGADVEELPTIRIESARPGAQEKKVFGELQKFDVVIFTSANGVSEFWRRLRSCGYDARRLSGIRIVAIGPGTSRKLDAVGLRADAMPDSFTTDAVRRLLTGRGWVRGKRILLARADIGSKELAAGLRRAGARHVEDFAVYRTRGCPLDRRLIDKLFSNGRKPYLTFTSASTVSHFVRALGRRRAQQLARKGRVVSIGPVTSGAVRREGLRLTREAKDYTFDGLVEAVVDARKALRRSGA